MTKNDEAITYQELEEQANRCSQYFKDMGLKKGDRIAILMENNIHYLGLIQGAIVAGLHYVTISRHFKTSEIEYIILDSKSKVFVTSQKMSHLAKDIFPKIPHVKHKLMTDGKITGYESYEEKMKQYSIAPVPEDIEGRDMLYSSGTTGRPKGVISKIEDMPFGVLHPSIQAMIAICGLGPDTVYLSPAPLYHAAPLRFCLWVIRMGGTVVIMDKFSAEEALADIEKYRVTHSQWVPTMFIRMLKLPEEIRQMYDLSTLRLAIHAAAPCPVEIKQQMIDWWGPVLFEYYSGTEGNTFTAIDSKNWLSHRGSVGQCFAGKIHILDDEGKKLPPLVPGNIFVEGGNEFEYYNDPEKTATSRSKEGWNSIGDIGYLDEEDYLYLTDRKADMIISGGVNIYPQEVEDLLTVHPKVYDVAVFGIPNDDFGEEVKAVIQPVRMEEAGSHLEKELIAYCHKYLSKIKCPKSIDFTLELPRTPTGKLLKRILKDKFREN